MGRIARALNALRGSSAPGRVRPRGTSFGVAPIQPSSIPPDNTVSTVKLKTPSASNNVTKGSATKVPVYTRNDKGQIISEVETDITAGGQVLEFTTAAGRFAGAGGTEIWLPGTHNGSAPITDGFTQRFYLDKARTLSGLRAKLDFALPAGKTVDVHVYVNGVVRLTVSFTDADAGDTWKTTATTYAASAGDYVQFVVIANAAIAGGVAAAASCGAI